MHVMFIWFQILTLYHSCGSTASFEVILYNQNRCLIILENITTLQQISVTLSMESYSLVPMCHCTIANYFLPSNFLEKISEPVKGNEMCALKA